MKYRKTIIDKNHKDVFERLLTISDEYKIFSILNSNDFSHDKYSKYDWIAAFSHIDLVKYRIGEANNFSNFLEIHDNEWKFLYLSYDLKNKFEKLSSNNTDKLGFYDVFIFIPKFIIYSIKGKIELLSHEDTTHKEEEEFIESINTSTSSKASNNSIQLSFNHRVNRIDYLKTINNIREDIKYGDIYEMNFCQEFYVDNIELNPLDIYNKLTLHSPAPFSAFFKENERFIMSASPERYIQKTNNKILSQPIKGTAKRTHSDKDSQIKSELQNSIKERAENIMIVDLVRNDLSRIAASKNVKVDELCEIYNFPHVFQMISTVSCELEYKTNFTKILESTFPMGSMTGAPKIKAMELIEKYETSKRGIFSGSVGYIDDKGDFDFNVIIRTLLYNSKNKYLSLTTGGAITYLSDAEQEYEESLLKAEAVFEVFSSKDYLGISNWELGIKN